MPKKANNRRVSAEAMARRQKASRTRSGGLWSWLFGSKRRKNAAVKSSNKSRQPVADPEIVQERKVRNRVYLAIFLLVGVNGYVFLGRDDWQRLGLHATVLREDVVRTFAAPPVKACTEDPVRIFAGLANQVFLDHRLSSGRSLRLALLDLGIAPGEIDGLESALRPTVDPALLGGTGAPLRVAIDRDGKVQAIEVEAGQGHLIQACRTEATFRTRNIQHPLSTKVLPVHLTIGENQGLTAAIEAAGEEPELGARLAEVLAGNVDLAAQVRPGDKISVLLEKRYLGRHFHRYGNLLVVLFSGEAGRVEAFHHASPKASGSVAANYYNPQGQPIVRAWLRSPIAYYPTDATPLSLGAQTEFVQGNIGGHYARPLAAPVVALADATVHAMGNDARRGEWLELKSADGYVLSYWHLLRRVGPLAVGTVVRPAQVIALVGRSGMTAQSRLRLEIVDAQQQAVDPARLERGEVPLPAIGEALTGAAFDEFTRTVKTWRQALAAAGKARDKRKS